MAALNGGTHLGSSTRAGAFRRHRAQAHAWPSANPSPRAGASGRSGGSMPMSVPATPAYASLRALTRGPPAPASSWLISRREVAAPRLPAAAGGLGRARGMLQCVCPVLHTDCCLHATSIRLLGSIRCDSKVQLLSAGRCLEADDLGFEMEQWVEWNACEPFHGAQGQHICTSKAEWLPCRPALLTSQAVSGFRLQPRLRSGCGGGRNQELQLDFNSSCITHNNVKLYHPPAFCNWSGISMALWSQTGCPCELHCGTGRS